MVTSLKVWQGVVGPSVTFHKAKKVFSLTSLAWETLIFLLLASRDLATFLQAVALQREGPVQVQSDQFAKAVVAAARLPIYDFGEVHPFAKVALQLNTSGASSYSLNSGLYGSIQNGWSTSSTPVFGQFASQYEGDGKTKQFEFFHPESVSLQHWT
jgi:hypothetical protein